MDIVTLTSQVLARADELMTTAPGRVNVQRVTDIAEVRALRAAREVLTEHEHKALQQLRLQTMERLDGSVAIAGPKVKEKKGGILRSLFPSSMGGASSLSADVRAKREFEDMARQAGVPNRLPAPVDLIDAAENWVVSYLVADRVDIDLQPLRVPWLEATITNE